MTGLGVARFPPAFWLVPLTILWPSASAAAHASATAIESIGVPAGFAELTRPRELVVDVFFGGKMIGEAKVLARPGFLQFKNPDQVLGQVPELDVSPELSELLATELPTHSELVCTGPPSGGCGELSPPLAGIIFDESHFRVDLFINPRFLRLMRPQEQLYLATPAAGPSLTSSSGLALSGSSGRGTAYNIQNRTILGYRNARIRSDLSYASHIGLVADTIVAEVDRPRMRYSAGLFWAPGLDLTGERRIVGVGVGTQFDTRTDHDTLDATPLVLFLAQPSRVEMLVDGRLVTSAEYSAGNNLLDTSSLPDGSYPLVLRIHDANGAIREERRFFTKDAQIAPVGQEVYFAYAGKLANTRPNHPLSVSGGVFYQLGAARRINQALAADVSVIGTSDRPMVELGGWLLTRVARVRAAGLASAKGDFGALLQIASAHSGRLSVNFDLRRIWSHDGTPLLPLSTYVNTFDSAPPDSRQIGTGSFTQASGNIGYQLGSAYLSVIGSLRKDEHVPLDYSIGPNLSWPFFNRNGLQIALQADAQLTRSTRAAFVGFRLLFNKDRFSVLSQEGARSLVNKEGTGPSKARMVGDTTAQMSYSDGTGTDLSLGGGLTRDVDSSAAHAEAELYSRLGNARADLVQGIEGSHRTQYGLTAQIGAVVERHDAVLGGRDLTESAFIVSVDGAPDNVRFDVLVNGEKRGRLRSGGRLALFVQPYRSYSIALRVVDAASVWYDSAARSFTLYPGNVQHVSWHAEHLLTVFGRAVHADGTAVANALITGKRGLGQSNSQGYFQIDTSAADILSFQTESGSGCKVKLVLKDPQVDYAPVGRVLCN